MNQSITNIPGGQEGWRPIETAPKDGTDVLLFYPLDGLRHDWNPKIVIGHWRHFESATDENWVFQSRAVRGYSPTYQPTHWMPLPMAPTGE